MELEVPCSYTHTHRVGLQFALLFSGLGVFLCCVSSGMESKGKALWGEHCGVHVCACVSRIGHWTGLSLYVSVCCGQFLRKRLSVFVLALAPSVFM